jgi:hypothetical protein
LSIVPKISFLCPYLLFRLELKSCSSAPLVPSSAAASASASAKGGVELCLFASPLSPFPAFLRETVIEHSTTDAQRYHLSGLASPRLRRPKSLPSPARTLLHQTDHRQHLAHGPPPRQPHKARAARLRSSEHLLGRTATTALLCCALSTQHTHHGAWSRPRRAQSCPCVCPAARPSPSRPTTMYACGSTKPLTPYLKPRTRPPATQNLYLCPPRQF